MQNKIRIINYVSVLFLLLTQIAKLKLLLYYLF